MEQVYSVTQVNSYVKNLFVSDYALSHIYIKGEVSNCKYHSSGHIYFTLKDAKGAIACVMFAGSRQRGLKFRMVDGQSVVAGGNVSVYERDGRYQLYAKEIILDGAGALYEEYERLKQKLYEEGLFDHELKKPIPRFPKRVGIVTASTGAAIQDIKSIAARRNPFVQLVLYPAQVQGEGAAQTIVRGIEVLDQMNMDTIIIGRGGGSIEDLWPFNEEIVARAIFRAKTPIISGTGHETDTTIADYAADLRAPTPSAACELAIPDYRIMDETIQDYKLRMQKLLDHKITMYHYRLEHLKLRLIHQSPENQLAQKQLYYAELADRLNGAMKRKMTEKRHQVALYIEKLNGLAPTRKLIHGYGYVTGSDGAPIHNVLDVRSGDSLTITMMSGHIEAKAENIIQNDHKN